VLRINRLKANAMDQTARTSDEEILERATIGDHLAFERIVNQHRAMVFSLSYHFLRDRGVAEELAQDVFLSLYRNIASIESASHLLFWLRKVTVNRCLDQARKRKLRPQVRLDQIPEPSVEATVSDSFLSGSLEKLIGQLTENQWACLILRYQEDLDPSEIAVVLKMPVNTVKSHLRRSLAALRGKLSYSAEKEYEPSRRTTQSRVEAGTAVPGFYCARTGPITSRG
jgi:RNA polymerase sigma-70 factor (ECF subfamily)